MSARDALLTPAALGVVLDGLLNGFQLVLSMSGEIFGFVLLYYQLDRFIAPDTAAIVSFLLLTIAVLYLITRIDRLYREVKHET